MAVTPTQLNQFLNQYFSLFDLQTLCLELNIPFEDLDGGDNRAAKALSLVKYAQRHSLYDAVVTHAQAQRPNARLGDMPTPTQSAAQSATTATAANPADKPAEKSAEQRVEYHFHGPVTGAAIGGSTLTAQNIAGRDINIGPVPQTRDEFAAQLQQLETLLQQAIAAKELPTTHDAETLVEDLEDVVKEVKAEQPRNGRITRRLEDMTEIVDSAGKVAEAAGKTGAFILKAAPILAGLAKAVQMVF
ncbi:MAG: hypothetical protein KF770_32885 [Anaerolineae bacterium]|nr:hypothetical protein [Anaerolineae bacterium]